MTWLITYLSLLLLLLSILVKLLLLLKHTRRTEASAGATGRPGRAPRRRASCSCTTAPSRQESDILRMNSVVGMQIEKMLVTFILEKNCDQKLLLRRRRQELGVRTRVRAQTPRVGACGPNTWTLRGAEGVPRKGAWASVDVRVWTCKESGAKHNQTRCHLRPPLLGTPLVPSRWTGAMRKAMRTGICVHTLARVPDTSAQAVARDNVSERAAHVCWCTCVHGPLYGRMHLNVADVHNNITT